MKNLLLSILFLLSLNTFGQVELKGIQLNEKSNWEDQMTSLIGNDYYIGVSRINDGRVYMILCIPAENSNVRRVYFPEIEKLKNALENKYSIKLKWINSDDYNDKTGWWTNTKDGITYSLNITGYNQFMDIPYDMSFYMYNEELYKINEKEDQKRANSDL